MRKLAVKALLKKLAEILRKEACEHSEVLFRKLKDEELQLLYDDLKEEMDKRKLLS